MHDGDKVAIIRSNFQHNNHNPDSVEEKHVSKVDPMLDQFMEQLMTFVSMLQRIELIVPSEYSSIITLI